MTVPIPEIVRGGRGGPGPPGAIHVDPPEEGGVQSVTEVFRLVWLWGGDSVMPSGNVAMMVPTVYGRARCTMIRL